jgi:hypothetical protein
MVRHPGARESWDERRHQRLGWLLAAAHGASVRDAAGARIGRVAWLRYGRDDRWPDAVMVRPSGWRAALSRLEREVPFAAVRAVEPERGEVLTDLEPALITERRPLRLARRGAASP